MSIAMRMPAVTHRPIEIELGDTRTQLRRRSAWHRLGWTGVEALVFLGLLIVIALVAGGGLARLLWRGWTVGVVVCGDARDRGAWVQGTRPEDSMPTLRLRCGRISVVLFATREWEG